VVTHPDAARLARTLGGPDLAWLVDRVISRLERDLALDGEIVLSAPSPAQRRAVGRLLGRPAGSGSTLTVSLPAVADVLRRAGIAPDLRTAVEALRGPVSPRSQVRIHEDRARAAIIASASACRHADCDWFRGWLADLNADGTLTRLIRAGRSDAVGLTARVLDRLPADNLPLPVLAQQVCGDTKALSEPPLASLVLSGVRRWSELDTAPVRDVWASVGVVLDDLASQVLVLNVPAAGTPLGRWLTDAATAGIPFRVTLHQLTVAPVTVELLDVFVCENPAVLRVAAAELGATAAPLICTEGVPSVAVHRLIASIVAGGATVHWRGDFDWVGVRTTADAVSRYGAVPWRMSVPDYLEGLAGAGVRLQGRPVETPWDPALGRTMSERGFAVMEEHLIPLLLDDLGSGEARRSPLS